MIPVARELRVVQGKLLDMERRNEVAREGLLVGWLMRETSGDYTSFYLGDSDVGELLVGIESRQHRSIFLGT